MRETHLRLRGRRQRKDGNSWMIMICIIKVHHIVQKFIHNFSLMTCSKELRRFGSERENNVKRHFEQIASGDVGCIHDD
jgi:hypothetical protein